MSRDGVESQLKSDTINFDHSFTQEFAYSFTKVLFLVIPCYFFAKYETMTLAISFSYSKKRNINDKEIQI